MGVRQPVYATTLEATTLEATTLEATTLCNDCTRNNCDDCVGEQKAMTGPA